MVMSAVADGQAEINDVFDDLDKGCLSGAIGPQQTETAALADGHAHPVDGPEAPVVFVNVNDFQEGFHRRYRFHGWRLQRS